MKLPLTQKDILAICGRTYLERGRGYQREGRVLDLQWDDDEEALYGRVRGSGRNVYEQYIQHHPRQPRRRFMGECTCPMQYDCKHVAAVLLQWLSEQQAPASRKTPENDLVLWKRHVQDLLDTTAPPETAGNALIYLLKPISYRDNTKIFLHAYKSRQLKRGGWGKPTPFNLSHMTGYYYYPPYWVTPLDQQIAELTEHGMSGSSTPTIAGDVGVLLFKRLLASGRCFWEGTENPPLKRGPVRRAGFEWPEQADGSRHLHITLEGLDGPWVASPTEPPWYIDPQRHECGPVEQPLPDELFHALCHLPEVATSELESFSRFLFPVFSPEALPLPAELDIETCDHPPTPVLLLHGELGPRGNTIHMARVRFAYGSLHLPPGNEKAESRQLLHHDGRDWLIQRHPEFELACLDRLTALGLEPAARADAGETGEWDLLFTGATVARSAARWREFLAQLPRLEEEGWTIETALSFRLRFDTVENLGVTIDETDRDWFDIGLDIEYLGTRIPLLPVLTEWLEQGDATQPVLIGLDDGAWLEVPQSILTPIAGTLVELYQRPSLNDAGHLSLPRQQAPWLQALEDQLDDEGCSLRWQGGEQIRSLARRLRDFQGIEAVAPPTALQAELRPYQRQGLSWLQFLRDYGFGGVLADDMGLGKTLQALAHLLAEKQAGRLDSPALVVAPTSVLGNWRREATRFAPALDVLILHGPARAEHFDRLGHYDLIITSYALLPRDLETLRQNTFHSVILDEAQAIKNAKSKAAQAACALPTENRLCLTGTPLENHLGELWSLFHFLMPGFLGTEKAFNALFRHPIEKRGDTDRRRELVRRLTPFILRRDKTQVASELPPKTEIAVNVELGSAQRRLYESIRVAMAERIGTLMRQKGLARSHIEMLDALLKLRQACCDPRLVKLQSAGKVEQSAKLEMLMGMLGELLEEGRKVLLFSQFTSMLTLIEKELKARRFKYVKLTGRTRKRDEVIAAFQQGEAPLFLVSLKAGGVGLNLTAADTVIHYDPWWNPAVENQATDRAYRIGQDKPVFVYKLVTTDSVEEKILQLQQRKQALADDIYRKTEEGEKLSVFNAEEILSLFAP